MRTFIKPFCLLFITLVGFVGASLTPLLQQASALTGSDFQAGNIISGAVFTNYNSMSAQDIQTFLDAKLPTCDTIGSQPSSHANPSGGYYTRAQWGAVYDAKYNTNIAATPYVCLKNYIENPSTKQNNLLNPNVYISGGQTAAQIIYNAAQAYKINPEVLLITLQKEQGLVTDDWPWVSEYSAAMGYACPDDGTGCHSQYSGFAVQLDSAAWQYRDYLNNPSHYNFSTGNNYINYNTSASACGNGSIVSIQNLSTAALYNYTPYQPDSNVLASTNPTSSANAGSASGDNCATYGNRNFWWYFTKWFGSTQTTIPYAWNFYAKDVSIDAADLQLMNLPEGTISLQPGGKAYIHLRALNNGDQTWQKSTFHLGTSNPQDRCSIFSDTTWLSCNRIQMTEQSVAPGDIATFNFSITAPSSIGSYKESFNLVAENITWLNNPQFYLSVDVVPHQPVTNISVSNRLLPDQSLLPGQYLMAPDAHNVLVLQQDGNLVLYSNFQPVWSSGTQSSNVSKLLMQSDGNLVLYDQANHALWSSRTNGSPSASLLMQSDGNNVIYNASNSPIWSSATNTVPDNLSYVNHRYPKGAIIYPQQKLSTTTGQHVLQFQADGNLVLYSSSRPIWASNTNGMNASYMILQNDGNLVIYNTRGKPLWSSNTSGKNVSYVGLQDDGNVVMYDAASNQPVWSTNTYGR